MQNLLINDSLPKHLDSGLRHMQLCRQNKGGEKYLNAIEPHYNDLSEKADALKTSSLNRVVAKDTVRLKDLLLDDELRKLHNRAKEYDKDFPGSKLTVLLFPLGKISSTISKGYDKEPEIADQIVLKVESLGETHPLYPMAAAIRTAISGCKDALEGHKQAEEAEATAKTIIDLSKANFRKAYSDNYHLAAQDTDKRYAEKLFPKVRASSKGEEE